MVEVECHISIKKDDHCFLEPKKMRLLKGIIQTGSLRGAAKELKISYQTAWNMMNEMNNMAPKPLIIKQRGGVNGGGAELSAYGALILLE